MISIWDIRHICLREEINPDLPLLLSFRAHAKAIQCIDYMEANEIIISASIDCNVRLHTSSGVYIGTLGQYDPWDLSDPSTFSQYQPLDVILTEMEGLAQDDEEYQDLFGIAQMIQLQKKRSKNGANAELSDSGIPDEKITRKSKKVVIKKEADSSGESSDEEEKNDTPSIVQDQKTIPELTTRRMSVINTMKRLPPINMKLRGPIRVRNSGATSPTSNSDSSIDKTNRVRTADLIGKRYNSWYARTAYAKEKKYRPPHQAYRPPAARFTYANMKNGIYHSLNPVELAPLISPSEARCLISGGK